MIGFVSRIGLAALVGFLLVAALVVSGSTTGVDDFALKSTAGWREGIVGAFVHAATFLGSGPGLLGVALIAMLVAVVRRQRRWAILPGPALMAAWMANQALKALFQRPRPSPEFWPDAGTYLDRYAFPSGHAMDSAALYGALVFWLVASGSGWRGRLAAAGVALMPVAIGLSRVALGVHWLSDVVGGWLAGVAVLSLVLLLWHRLVGAE